MAPLDPSGTPVQPSLADLMARYLERRAEAEANGLVSADASGEVVPFEAAPVQAVDPRLAWDEALTAVRFFGESKIAHAAPPDWPALVSAQEPAVALAFAVGNFPQLVRHVQPLLNATDLKTLKPAAGRALPLPNLLTWATQTAAKHDYPQALLALGALRLARQFEAADALVKKHAKEVPAEWQSAWANEEAALAWHRGDADLALKLWRSQADSVPIMFNRGMAALFLGKPTDARKFLNQAIANLPEDGAWHHLGKLYLALAEMRN